jgi:hypothetical protein
MDHRLHRTGSRRGDILSCMDISQMLRELYAERDRLIEAIAAIEGFAAGRVGKRRGRPPKWLSEAKAKALAPRKRGRPRKHAA